MNRNPAEPATVPVDFAQLDESTLGDAQFGRELTALFVQQTQEQLSQMQALLAAGDAEALGALTHRLKGSATALGAERLRAEAAQLEQEAAHGELGVARGRLIGVQAAFEEARRILEHHFGVAAS